MKMLKMERLPKKVLKRAKIIGNIFDKINKKDEVFESIVCELLCLLKDKYNLTDKQWNKDVAPILVKYYL